MTGRIIAGFLTVLTAVLMAIVIPLGLMVTAQQTRDFADQVERTAMAVGALAEEHLDDLAPVGALTQVIGRFSADGYRIAVLGSHGRVVARAGREVPAPVLEAAVAGAPLPQSDDSLAVTEPVDDAGRLLGRIVLARDTTALDAQHHRLWALLATAAAGALALGVLIAWLLSRWIARPLTGLLRAAQSVGHGAATTRANENVGPTPIRQVATAFNAMSDRVRALLATQRGMTAEVSHQLRTPLAALRLRLELFRDDLPVDVAAQVTGMVEETERLTRLLDGLLAIARAEATGIDPVCTDIGDIAAERIAIWQPVATDRQVRLQLRSQPAVAAVTPGHLEQVLDNLLDNAMEATPPGGWVSVAVSGTDAEVELTVADTGPGMTVEQRARAMDRWATTEGTGLGLAIVQRLVEADNGTVRLSEAPGGGLRVTIRFALASRSRTAVAE